LVINPFHYVHYDFGTLIDDLYNFNLDVKFVESHSNHVVYKEKSAFY